jgi:hypothetical protein
MGNKRYPASSQLMIEMHNVTAVAQLTSCREPAIEAHGMVRQLQ